MSSTQIQTTTYKDALNSLDMQRKILERELSESIIANLELIFQKYRDASLTLDPIERVDTYGDKETFIHLDDDNLLGINFLLTNSQFDIFRSIDGARIVGVVFDKEGTPTFLKSPLEERVSFPDFQVYGDELVLRDLINIAEGINQFMWAKGI